MTASLPPIASLWHEAWSIAWQGVGARGSGLAERQAVLTAYAGPHRHYHTQQHLAECLTLWTEYRALASHPAVVGLALWFHDAVYDPRATNNEMQSAAWAERVLRDAGVPNVTCQAVKALILATRHQEPPADPETALVVDIDLAILGADPARYAEYERQIRAEYAWVPPEVFIAKRRAVLEQFWARAPLYHTAPLRARFEAPARRNLAQALAQLASG